jgi:hypothetical protein
MSLSLEVAAAPSSRFKPWAKTAWRYGFSASGPMATSAAHFLASLLFVRNLAAASFGIFSFVLVIVPFAMSAVGALLVVPVTLSLHESDEKRAAVNACCLKLNLLLTALTGFGVSAALLLVRTPPMPAILLGLFGGALTFRWFGRCFAYVQGRMGAAVQSDFAYALALIAGLGVLIVTHVINLDSAALVMTAAALLGLVPLGRSFFLEQLRALRTGKLALYRSTFRDLTRWSLLGVATTELTVNAHVYLVTFIAGPGAFALLALGMLLMRPASLMQSALPDMERPLMTRQIAAHDWNGLKRTRRNFGFGLAAALLATLALDAALLTWFPLLVLKRGYDLQEVLVVTALCAAIMLVRALRVPQAVQLQAAGLFKQLAAIGSLSCVISLLTVLALLMAFGPIASLGGVFLGELTILLRCRALLQDWQARNV